MKRILVTGCAGFIGSHLCEKLLENYKVIGIDNLSRGFRTNMSAFYAHGNFSFFEMDVLDSCAMLKLLKNYEINSVFHFAANSDISIGDHKIELRDTFDTTIALLRICARHNIKEFIFASSGSVYGEMDGYVKENRGPLIPISYYAAAKLSSEAWISAYASMCNIKSWICRFPAVVGEHATHGIIYDFIKKIRKNPDILEVLGDGTQKKSYIYVKELIDAIIFLWKHANDQVNLYNIACEGEVYVKEIAPLVILKMGTPTKIQFTGGTRAWPGDVPFYYCNTEKINNLGWHAKLTSYESVELAIERILKYDPVF